MRQLFEFRVVEEFASRLFSPSEGQVLSSGLIRKVILRDDDPRVPKVAALQVELNAEGKSFFLGWEIHRRYSKRELASAESLQLVIVSVFEPAGEECGTSYDDAAACVRCGAGAPRPSPLILDTKRIPRRDVSRTTANEVVVSNRLVELFRREGVTGVEFGPIYTRGTVPLLAQPTFREPVILDERVEIASPTRIGSGLFGRPEDDQYRCPEGDVLGLGLLSELWFHANSRGAGDVAATRAFLGVRRGLLRPHQCILLSQKAGSLMLREKLTGFKLEVARAMSTESDLASGVSGR